MRANDPVRTKDDVATAFDGKAGRYRDEREREYGFMVQRRLVLDMIAGRGGRALEVGCGSGGIARDLVERGYAVAGIDISPAMAKTAAARIAIDSDGFAGVRVAGGRLSGERLTGARFACADVERLSFPDASFDLVIGMGFLEYLPDPARSCAEIRRVLKPGGEAILTVPTSVSPSARMDRLFDALPASVKKMLLRRRELPKGDPVHRLAPWHLDRVLRDGGLCPDRSAFCHFTMFPFERVLPKASESLARLLEPLGGNRVTGLLGKQYLVRAVAR